MARTDEGFFSSRDGLRLFWRWESPDAPKAAIGIVHGYGDHSGRYRWAIDALVEAGFSVHAFDFRGHGQADGRRGYCDSFDDYVEDTRAFLEKVRRMEGDRGLPLYLLGHSTGSLILLRWLLRAPEEHAGLIFSAPYISPAFVPPRHKLLAAQLLGRLVPWLPISTGLTSVDLSSDPEAQRETDTDELYNRIATPRWFNETTAVQGEAEQLAALVSTPFLLLAGGEDGVADTSAARRFFEQVPSTDKRFKEYPGMRHEILNEVGRAEVFDDISGWISSHL